MKLDQALFEQIVDLLQPHMSESGRRTLITPAFSVYDKLYSQIDWSGSNRAFTVRLVQQLIDYGQVTPGQDALALLLKTLRGQIGVDVQARIDGILGELTSLSSVSPIPKVSNKISVNKWRTSFLMGLGVFAILLLFAVYKYIFPHSTVAHEYQCEYGVVVRGLATDESIGNAKLTLTYQLDSYTAFTTSEGRYRGEFSCGETRPSYQLRVDAAGYLPYANEYILQREFVRVYLISNATPLCPYGTRVQDKVTQAQIPNAKVQIELGLYHATGYTDSEGHYDTDLPCTGDLPSIKVQVSAADYETYRVDYYLNDEIQEVRLDPLE